MALLGPASGAGAQAVSERGFIEAEGVGFLEAAPNDPRRVVGDALLRQEVFLDPTQWLRIAAGLDVRANSHHQVEDEWRLDVDDRTRLRPRAALRRLSITASGGGVVVEVGKQFLRWGRADIIFPSDRFAPRDYLNVTDAELLPVVAARASVQIGSEVLEAVWVPRLTPSRLPLFDQRWSVIPAEAAGLLVVDEGGQIPGGAQFGGRWRHAGNLFETAVSFFDGFSHLPDLEVNVVPQAGTIDVSRRYPAIRMFAGDAAVPAAWFTLKAEAAYVTSPAEATEEYVLYAIEVERQAGEWLLDVGYAGSVVTTARPVVSFDPNRGMARSIIGRAAYTIDPRRSVTIEGAVRQRGEGFYAKGEYTQAFGQHWRLTLAGVGLGGNDDDFLGRYRRNNHGSVALRFSY